MITSLLFLHFRYVMSNLNISGRRIVTNDEVEEMINAVDDGDGKLDFGEFVQLIRRRF
jgi:Ca2+-binding EF-hand superfamily protein